MWQAITGSLDFTKTIAIVSLFVSIAGFSITLINSYFTWQNRKLALKQEERKMPSLGCSLIHGLQKTGETGRSFSIHVMIRNPSDINNAVANAELVVEYLTEKRILMTVKLQSVREMPDEFVRGQGDSIKIPARIGSHEAISGWLHFFAPNELLKGLAIESYSLVLTDTHDEKTAISPNLMQEYRDEV